jgi:site-specific DNA-methyltransferase (adenine-specific)/modification methylase
MSLPGESKIYLGDCIEIMKTFPDAYVDLVITDPPYGVYSEVIIHRFTVIKTQSQNPKKYKYTGKDIKNAFNTFDRFETDEAYWNFTEEWLKETSRVLKDTGHFVSFIDQNKGGDFARKAKELGFILRQWLYWKKSNPTPRARRCDFMIALEAMIWLTKTTKSGATFNYQLGQQPNYFEASVPHNEKGDRRFHPTQKPLKVIETLLRYLSNSGDMVLDPFMGSGSIVVACIKTNRRYIGIEKDEKYFNLAKNRIDFFSKGIYE